MTAAATALEINRAYYREHADEFCLRTETVSMETSYEPFLRLTPKGGHILDAGCGSGRDAVAFIARGYRVTAIDASPDMVRAANARGVDARELAFQQIEFSAEFHGVWACASLLHVPRAEMSSVLRQFAKALKPDGVLYASLKKGSGERVAEDGRFFSYFTLDEFSDILVREALFDVLEEWENAGPDSSGAVRPWINFLARRYH